MPINPIHMALLNNGKVLVVAGSGNVSYQDELACGHCGPGARPGRHQQVPWDMFCNGMVTLPDGRVLINGGNLQYNPFLGERRNAVYDPATGRVYGRSRTWRTGVGIPRRRSWVMAG